MLVIRMVDVLVLMFSLKEKNNRGGGPRKIWIFLWSRPDLMRLFYEQRCSDSRDRFDEIVLGRALFGRTEEKNSQSVV